MTEPLHDSMPGAKGTYRHGDSGTSFPPRYDGPRMLAQALTRLARSDQPFTREGPRADVEYRDLGWAEASGGMIDCPTMTSPSLNSGSI